jgi:hypothetical protein
MVEAISEGNEAWSEIILKREMEVFSILKSQSKTLNQTTFHPEAK